MNLTRIEIEKIISCLVELKSNETQQNVNCIKHEDKVASLSINLEKS